MPNKQRLCAEYALELGVTVTNVWHYKGVESVTISLDHIYHGSGALNDLRTFASLCETLAKKRFKPTGCSLVYGYYDAIDDIEWTLERPIPRKKTTT